MPHTYEEGQALLKRWANLEIDTDDPALQEEFRHWEYGDDGQIQWFAVPPDPPPSYEEIKRRRAAADAR